MGLKPEPSHGALLPAGSMVPMRRKAFTLVELLVVVAVIAILISLLLPAINRFRVQAQSTECLTNQRNLIAAYTQYSIDRNGKVPGTDTGTFAYDWVQTVSLGAPGQCCGVSNNNVGNWDGTGTEANPNTEYPAAFTEGSLWDYIGDLGVYSSPQDPRIINDLESYALRSYSFSAFAGKEAFCVHCQPNQAPPLSSAADSYSQFRDPSNHLSTLCEADTRGANLNGFLLPEDWLDPDFDPCQNSFDWGDEPVVWNPGRWNVSFIDGSVTSYQLKMSEETARTHFFVEEPDGPYPNIPSNTACEDADWLSSKLQPKMLRSLQ